MDGLCEPDVHGDQFNIPECLFPLQSFDDKDPFGLLARAAYSTFHFLGSVQLIGMGMVMVSEADVMAYHKIVGVSGGGIVGMCLTLELIPILHRRQFPSEDPSPAQLGDIARRSWPFLEKLAGLGQEVAVPLSQYYFGKNSLLAAVIEEGRIGILDDWMVIDEVSNSKFELIEDSDGMVISPIGWEIFRDTFTKHAQSRGRYSPNHHCPVPNSALQTLWGRLIDIAEIWHFPEAIDNFRG